MTRIKLMLAALGAVAVTISAAAALAATKSTPSLLGTVGPGFTISLKDSKGKTVKTLPAGKYTVKVIDKSNIHNFHLKGPGVDKEITDVGFQGTKTVTVTLKKGKYTFVCDPHASTMHGGFSVT